MYDAVNAAGGINGCKIDYEIADDKADPQVAAQAARDLIDNKKVVAMSGGASLLECAVNAPTYKRADVNRRCMGSASIRSASIRRTSRRSMSVPIRSRRRWACSPPTR